MISIIRVYYLFEEDPPLFCVERKGWMEVYSTFEEVAQAIQNYPEELVWLEGRAVFKNNIVLTVEKISFSDMEKLPHAILLMLSQVIPQKKKEISDALREALELTEFVLADVFDV